MFQVNSLFGLSGYFKRTNDIWYAAYFKLRVSTMTLIMKNYYKFYFVYKQMNGYEIIKEGYNG
jgi:hypothetical protein